MVKMKKLDQLRIEINKIDEEMAKLFVKRMKVVEGIAKYKQSVGIKILDTAREKIVIEENSKRVTDEKLKKYYIKFLEKNMEISRDYQKSILGLNKIVGYQGIPGSFSYLALKTKYKDELLNSYQNFEDVFIALKDKEIDKGILPLENSYTGDITDNFDLMKKYNAYIIDIIELKIDHNLLGIKKSKLSDIKEVYSHIQGFKQSQTFLKERGYKEIPYYNTAISAKYISETNDITKGAIGSAETAKIYNLDILAKNINTHEDNTTRFMVIGNKLIVNKEHNRIMVAFSTYNRSGDLSSVLGEISKDGINMLSIKSRPLKDSPWEYIFFIELEGNYNILKPAIEEIEKKSNYFEVIGSYEK
jgi:chorismate mutase/prephenate dehydratase